MRQLWLEKLAEDGLIRKEAVPYIYEEVKAFMKEAEATFAGMTPEEVSKRLSQFIGAGLTGAAFWGVPKLMERFKDKRDVSKSRDLISKTRSLVIGQYNDPADIEKAQARFDEIAKYSPHAAMNAPLVTKLVRANLHSGISDETAQRLALVQSSYTKSLDKQQELLPKLGEMRPEVAGELMADLVKIAIPTAKDAGDFMRTVGAYSAVPLVAGLISGVGSSIWAKAKERDLRKELDNSFHVAVRQAPETHKDIFKLDMAKTRQAFDALAHFAPSVALQPHAARTFMKKMLDYYEQGGMNVTDVKELTEIEKNISSARKAGPFAKGFGLGSGFATSGPISKGVERATQNAMTLPAAGTNG